MTLSFERNAFSSTDLYPIHNYTMEQFSKKSILCVIIFCVVFYLAQTGTGTGVIGTKMVRKYSKT